MGISKVDKIYRSVVLKKFFTNGWGSIENLRRLFEFRKIICQRNIVNEQLVELNHPIHVDNVINSIKGAKIINGHFTSPLVQHLPGLLPPASETSYFQLIVPQVWKGSDKPICIHMAGTGDHYFWRRRSFLAKPLLFNDNVGSLLIENPFYGVRKPPGQVRSNLLHVADIFIMGGSLMLETIALLRWLENEGYGPFILHGISMGGHMASLAATNWPKPVAVAPGVMSKAVDWECLEKHFLSDERFIKEIIPMIYDNCEAYSSGKPFGKYCPTLLDVKASSQRIQNRVEALTFMHAVMDECTHLKNFACPVDTELVSIVAAKDDAYVLRDDVTPMEDLWPNCSINYTNSGHVSAFILYHVHFRNAINDSLDLLRAKYNLDGSLKNTIVTPHPQPQPLLVPSDAK